MKTILEPKRLIKDLLEGREGKTSTVYRMMRYVLREDYDGKVLLHNVVTGQCVVLDDDEAAMVDNLPAGCNAALDPLIKGYYLVPMEEDEHRRVLELREILQKLSTRRKSTIINDYTILPTTACNARCYYCFEQGCVYETMSKQVADDVVRFMTERCGPKKELRILWFGGEPTIAARRMDQISVGLSKRGISYVSDITTNGYLFDEQMVERAKELWHLRTAMICIDGTEENYNRIKAYINPKDNPYQRVMRNIGLLLNYGVRVRLRVNYDKGNYNEFDDILADVLARFGKHSLLSVVAHPIMGEYRDAEGRVDHADDRWLQEKKAELQSKSRSVGLGERASRMPFVNIRGCRASNDSSVTITPTGKLCKCPEQFDEEQIIGDIWKGITNEGLVSQWKVVRHHWACPTCVFFPDCISIDKCSGSGKVNEHGCYALLDSDLVYRERMRHLYDKDALKG